MNPGPGCSRCWPDDAQAAWEARSGLARTQALVDESHFIVSILRCRECAQQFITIFTEMIDWSGGDDAQYWTLAPVTAEEIARLAARGEDLGSADLNALPTRRALQRDFPKGAKEVRLAWAEGLRIGPHD